MEKEINQILEQVTKIIGEDADILIAVRKKENFGVVKHGDANNIAQALFSCMHNYGNSGGEAIYKIIKLNVMNIFANSSPYAIDLTKSITDIIQNKYE